MVGKLSKDMVKVETSSSLIPVEREPRSMNHMTHWSHPGAWGYTPDQEVPSR